jgi:hypothetical protein
VGSRIPRAGSPPASLDTGGLHPTADENGANLGVIGWRLTAFRPPVPPDRSVVLPSAEGALPLDTVTHRQTSGSQELILRFNKALHGALVELPRSWRHTPRPRKRKPIAGRRTRPKRAAEQEAKASAVDI